MALKQNFNNQSVWHQFMLWLNGLFNSEQEDTRTADASEEGDGPDEEASNEGDSSEPEENEDGTMQADAAPAQNAGSNDWTKGLMTTFLGALFPAASAATPAPPVPAAAPPAPVITSTPESSDHAAFPFVASPQARMVTANGATIQAPHSTAIFWGDSIADGMARSVRPGTFAGVTNLGTPGAGFLTSIKPQTVSNIPQNAAAFIYFGTNDVASLMGQSDAQIAAYAKRVIDVAQQMRAQGAEPVILGLNAPKGAYTGGSAAWRQEGFVDNWTRTMERLNEQYQLQAQAAGIKYAATDAQITAAQISTDNLHLTADGSRAMVNIGVQAIKS
ncbi:MAG: hypothetical protein KA099_12125 [Alphaproteobacteria bacterium]|nr:hypothetical protein [Alphaproteobacteria bacterium]MBP7759378.1 hypothetical protein [Alphaproteobacteria bacterium]MBP7762655.1 hypothetical protein [Alphaproteobacteria bacterium]MBP7906059.1 hypothetical protein [Alphaproteobacteria bacterium]